MKYFSIVSVSGDGLYHEVVNCLVLRQMREEGQDMDDPDIKMKPLSIPIGVIPTGSSSFYNTAIVV